MTRKDGCMRWVREETVERGGEMKGGDVLMMMFVLCDEPWTYCSQYLWKHDPNYELDLHHHGHINHVSEIQERINELLALCLYISQWRQHALGKILKLKYLITLHLRRGYRSK